MGRRKLIRRVVWSTVVMTAVVVVTVVLLARYSSTETRVEILVPDLPACIERGPLCEGPKCCNQTVAELFSEEDFITFFPYRDNPIAHAQGFYAYSDFIRAAKLFERKGFGLIGGEDLQKREIVAFFAHVGAMSSCGSSTSRLGGPYDWGLCLNAELVPSSTDCDKQNIEYPCVEGVSYHGRGPMFVTGNENYGWIGKGLDLDLLHHPELLENNATVAFASCVFQWMTPRNEKPAPHSVMVGQWIPTLNDTNAFRYPGFGVTINILDPLLCGHGYDNDGTKRVAHYNHYLGLLGNVPSGLNVNCELQASWKTPQSD